MAALSAGHLATDFAGGALPALLPFLVDKLSLSYTLAVVATPLLAWVGLKGGLFLALPCLVVAAGLLTLRRDLGGFVPERRTVEAHSGRDQPRAMAILLGVVAFRGLAWFGLLTFVPLW